MMAISAAVWAEAIPLTTAWNLKEISAGDNTTRKTMKEELDRIGYVGETPASFKANPFAAHFELHIEQGPILEDEGRKIGVVQGQKLSTDWRLILTIPRCSSVQMVRYHRQWQG